VNVPEKKEIEVTDAVTRSVLARWPVSAEDNFRLHSTKLIIARCLECGSLGSYWSLIPRPVSKSQPAKLVAKMISSTIPFGGPVYVLTSEGYPEVFEQRLPTTMTGSQRYPNPPRSQTGLFMLEWGKLFVAVPTAGDKSAEVRDLSDAVRVSDLLPDNGNRNENRLKQGDVMNRRCERGTMRILGLAIIVVVAAPFSTAQEVPSDYQQVLKVVGKSGDYKANVLKVNIPRNDLHMKIADYSVPTPFGFGGWFAMTKGDGGEDVVIGDLVLTQDEVNPVMSALLDHGLEVTALHNHFFWDEPRVFFMHIHGHGKALDLANQLKPAIDLIGQHKPAETGQASKAAPKQTTLDTDQIAKIVGHAGEQTGAVYKITIGRGDLDVKERGATINARMGLNTWAAFVGTNDDAAVAGDIAMLESEVQPTLKVLREHGLDVVAIHHHMINSQPVIIFLHYWGRGPGAKLATGFKAALDELDKGNKQ